MQVPIENANVACVPESTLMFSVADIRTRVICDDPTISLTASDSSLRFLVSDGEPEVTIRVHQAPDLTHPSGDMLFESGVVWRLLRDRDEYVFSFTSTSFGAAPYRIARFAAAFTTGTIWVNSGCVPPDGTITPLEYPLDELLMINLLGRGRGIEVHGCGVIDRDGRAYVFAGQSEAGKTTIARLWHAAGATILSDDRVILRARDGQVWVYGTPWHGEGEFAAPARAPLSRLLFLRQGPMNAAAPAEGAAAAARLFGCCFPPFHDPAGLHFTLELLTTILDRVPCFELTFLPDSRVIEFVRARA